MTAIETPTPDPRTLDDEARLFAEALAPNYAIKRELGRGGMGVVYLARDKRLDRLVAIKMLPAHLGKDPSVRERFFRETRTAGAMSHTNIVPILTANEVDDYVYFVMPYVQGESLAIHLQSLGKLAPRTVASYLRDVALALSHAHGRGIIHRDIKAENVLIDTETNRALVTDFGIARIAEATPLTVTGQVLGTVYYVSPEQVSGTAIDARSDIYSVGVVGFLSLTGRFPFEGDVASAVLVSHVIKTAPPIATINRDVPASLAAIIDRCLLKDPNDRFSSATELAAALLLCIEDLDRNPYSAPRAKPLATHTEAHSVWKRAAELQAHTGVEPRPLPVARRRDPAKNKLGGLDISVVRDAALEAGIDDTYVEHALIEHGLKGGKAAPPPSDAVGSIAAHIEDGKPLSTDFAREMVHEFVVEGEVAPRDFGLVVNMLRDHARSLGHVKTESDTLTWWKGRFGTKLQVTVTANDGHTVVRIVKNRRRSLAAVLAASVGVVAPITAMITVATVFEAFSVDSEGVAVISGFIAGASSTYWTARIAAQVTRARAEKRIRALGERVANKLRESLK